ncbi:hypothetical protein RHGRI_036610 [Rhododendron griersonianum]|uniref:PHD-type domain-containing protein n=1 Tax=Rhododendron griersonianum TaxID=479676 RepID=A0AAV6HP36_9ERIC|nr:hypothetical protein RHGRI_036610 [Rhododendron griersonianum]
MANGADAEEYVVVSRVRPGLKREFAFAWKSQADCAGSTGRTRARRTPNGALGNEASKDSSSSKRFKSSESNKDSESVEKHKLIGSTENVGSDVERLISVSEDEPKSDVVDSTSDDEQRSVFVESAVKEVVSMGIELVRDMGNAANEDAGKDVSEQPCEGAEISAQKLNTEPCDGVVERTEISAQKLHTEPCDGVVERAEISARMLSTEPGEGVIERAEISAQELNREPGDGVVERAEISARKLNTEPCDGVVERAEISARMLSTEPGDLVVERAEILARKLNTEPCDGVVEKAEISAQKSNREPGGVIERAFDETPVRRVTRSAVKVVNETLKRSDTEEVKTGDRSQSVLLGKLEKKTPKRIKVKKYPTMLKELLETGLLEGLPVKYLRGMKTRGPSDTGLRGIIKGAGILCSCDLCGGTQVVTPNQFELHAGSGNKRPPEYIYLDNGNTLRDVLKACREAPLDSLEVDIQNVIGCSVQNKTTSCMNCKGTISNSGSGRTVLLCNSCMILTESRSSPAPSSVKRERSPTTVSIQKPSDSGSSSGSRSRTVSIPKPSDSGSSSASRKGRITRKDLRMHKLVFQNDVLPDGTELCYFARGKVSPSQFEAHAGWASRRKPYLHIYTSNGVSLHELSIQLSKLRKLSTEENDDLCSICADGGDLLCCDCCPRAFHAECVSLPSIPGDTWYCKYCLNMFEKEKFVERNANAVAAGRIAGIDPVEEITRRCIRIVESADVDIGGCALCRGHGFSKSEFGPQTVILCDQCEKEYHVGCLKEHEMEDLKELPEGKWFCCMDCKRIHHSLQTLVANGEERLQESLLNVIKKKLVEKGSDSSADLDIKWRLLSGKMVSVETKALFVKAVAIFHDRFDPIADSNVRHSDLIPAMVYGRNVRDQEFGGMFCAILSVNSNVVSAGIIRVFGESVAEVPLVATSTECQGQGYFQVLFSCIENLLRSLNVRNLVLPAADEAESLWTNKFGFKKIAEDEVSEGIQEGISVDGISRDINASQIGGTVLKSSDAGTVITQNQENNSLWPKRHKKKKYGEKKKNESKQKTKSLQCFLGEYVQEAEMVFW